MLAGNSRRSVLDCGQSVAAVLAALHVLFALLFWTWPQLDLATASLFFEKSVGFVLAGSPFWNGVLLANKAASLGFICLALILFLVPRLRNLAGFAGSARYWGFVLLLYLAGPGLMVNGLIKRTFGRARPVEIELFGGEGPFSAAWEVSGYCPYACSFVSGEVSAATALLVGLGIGSMWFSGRPMARTFRALTLGALVMLLLTVVQRLGSGRHFLSDVIFAALLTLAVGAALACLLRPEIRSSAAPGTEARNL